MVYEEAAGETGLRDWHELSVDVRSRAHKTRDINILPTWVPFAGRNAGLVI